MLVDCGGTTKRRGSLSKLFRRNSRDSIVAPVVGDKADAESSRSPVDAVLENGDLAFHLTTFLVGNSAEEEDLSSLCCVSEKWTRTFALARSQLRCKSPRLRVSLLLLFTDTILTTLQGTASASASKRTKNNATFSSTTVCRTPLSEAAESDG